MTPSTYWTMGRITQPVLNYPGQIPSGCKIARDPACCSGPDGPMDTGVPFHNVTWSSISPGSAFTRLPGPRSAAHRPSVLEGPLEQSQPLGPWDCGIPHFRGLFDSPVHFPWMRARHWSEIGLSIFILHNSAPYQLAPGRKTRNITRASPLFTQLVCGQSSRTLPVITTVDDRWIRHRLRFAAPGWKSRGSLFSVCIGLTAWTRQSVSGSARSRSFTFGRAFRHYFADEAFSVRRISRCIIEMSSAHPLILLTGPGTESQRLSQQSPQLLPLRPLAEKS